MTCTIEIPDPVADALEWAVPPSSREIIEMLLLERYREGKVSRGRISQLLDMNFWETEEWLHRHGALIEISPEESTRDINAAKAFLRPELAARLR